MTRTDQRKSDEADAMDPLADAATKELKARRLASWGNVVALPAASSRRR